MATHGGLYNGPSGHPEPSRAVVEGDDKETRAVEAAARVRNELYASVLMETHEEVGVPLEKLKAPTLLGVMADPTGKPDLLFLVRTELDAAAVRECYAAGAEEGWESDRLATWPVADLAAHAAAHAGDARRHLLRDERRRAAERGAVRAL